MVKHKHIIEDLGKFFSDHLGKDKYFFYSNHISWLDEVEKDCIESGYETIRDGEILTVCRPTNK